MLTSCPHCDAPCYTEDIISDLPERAEYVDGFDNINRMRCPECGKEFLLVTEYAYVAVNEKGRTPEEYETIKMKRTEEDRRYYGC